MVELAIRRGATCKKCKRRQTYYQRKAKPNEPDFEVKVDGNGLCVDCAPVTHRCDRGAACEYERIHDWKACYGESDKLIPMLRLCDHHDTIRKQRLANA